MGFFDRLQAHLYYAYFEIIEKLLPQFIFGEKAIPRDSMQFRLYLRTLQMYAAAIASLDRKKYLYELFQMHYLRRTLALAEKTKWWHDYFKKHAISVMSVHTLDELSVIPPITRFDLVDVDKKDLLLLPAENTTIVWRRSGGSTTGTPFHWGLNKTLLTLHVMGRFALEMERQGLSLSTFARKGTYVEFNYPHRSHRSEFKWFSFGDFSVWSDDPQHEIKLNELVSALKKFEHVVVRTPPSEVHWLTGELKERNIKIPVSLFSITGNQLEQGVRSFTKEYFKCPVLVHYGAQEMGPLSFECREHQNFYHIFPERVIVEILDENGKKAPPGTEGNVTVTVLDNTVMPLIRYQPGDIGVVHIDVSCSCKNKSPLLEIRSRSTDKFVLHSGETLPARAVLKSFGIEPFVSSIERFQVRQEKFDAFTVRIQLRKTIPAEILSAQKERLFTLYGGKLSVSIEIVDSIPLDGPKFKVFVPLSLGGEVGKLT